MLKRLAAWWVDRRALVRRYQAAERAARDASRQRQTAEAERDRYREAADEYVRTCRELQTEIDTLTATLTVRDKAIEEYLTVIDRLQSIQERDIAVNVAVAEAAIKGGPRHASNRPVSFAGS